MSEEIRASQKLTDYLNKIEKETGRPIRLDIMRDSTTKRKMSSFREHPTHIYIIIPESCQLTDPETESSLAQGIRVRSSQYFDTFCWTLDIKK